MIDHDYFNPAEIWWFLSELAWYVERIKLENPISHRLRTWAGRVYMRYLYER